MIDLAYLKSVGVSSQAYKGVFTKPFHEMPESTQKLVRYLSSLVTDSRRQNLTEWRAHAAVDLAYDTPFAQTTPTILHHILDQHLDHKHALGALRDWGLREEDLYLDVPMERDGQKVVGKLLNPPVAVPILIPIVRAYTSIRLAKIFNDRNVHPLLKYEPLRNTSKSQVGCEIVTDLVDQIVHAYGYPAVLRQGLIQMLKYGTALAFPLEEWDCQKQFVDGKDTVIKEGLRYYWPHPTRMNYDSMQPLTSINTDSGVEWGLHWRVIPYGDVLDSDDYWNKDSIFQGTNWFAYPDAGSFFSEFYPCQMMDPLTTPWNHEPKLREDKAYWYTTNVRNRACFITEVFAKISPKRWGLGNYTHKVWHRFTIAGDDTVIFASPCGYNPMWFLGYDYDQAASRNASLALECIPWQDEVGNILNQIIEHAKENLASIIFYNNLAVSKEDIHRVQHSGNKMYTDRLFIGYDPSMMAAAKIGMTDIFTRVDLGGKPVIELLQTIPLVLNMMERILQISPQEAGSAASHQQSKKEVELTAGASTNRVSYTCSFVDEGIQAWKQQLFDACMCYLDPEVEAEISAEIPDVEKIVQDLGFQISGHGDGTLLVKGPKHPLKLESFSDTGKGADILHDRELAQLIFQTVGTVAGQEDLHKKFGAKKLMWMVKRAFMLAGGEASDFPAYVEQEGADDEVPENIQKAIEQAQQALEQKIAQSLAQPIAKEMAGEQQQLTEVEQALKAIQQIVQKLQQDQDKAKLKAQEAQQRMQIQAAEAQQRLAIKQQEAQVEQALTVKQGEAEAHAVMLKTQAEVSAKGMKAQGDLAIAHAKAAEAPAKKE